MEEARLHAGVEQWFHSLVKKYFKGSIKVHFTPLPPFPPPLAA